MADSKETTSSLGERQEDHELIPDSAPNPIEDLNPANDERSLDIGESGQFAPGGRYNELGATRTPRIDLDEQVDSALSDEKS